MNEISRLGDLIREEKIHEVLKILDQMQTKNDTEDLLRLFTTLNDNSSEDIMISIVHAIEFLPDQEYVQGYLDYVEHIFDNSPRWASMVLIRIVNNAETYSILKKLLKSNPSKLATMEKVRTESLKIKREMPSLS